MRFFWCACVVSVALAERAELVEVKAHTSTPGIDGCRHADPSDPTVLDWVQLPGTFCMDGSTPGYYAKPALNWGASGSKRLVIYIKGGGGCTDNATCIAWANETTGGGRFKGSAVNYKDTKDVKLDPKKNTIFLSDNYNYNPHFCDAHHVYIPYCTGDSHMGTVEEPSDASWGMMFSGHNNFKTIVEHLKSLISVDEGEVLEILLYGTSAGARGALTNCDWLKDNWEGAEVSCSMWAGWYFPGNTENIGIPDLPPTAFQTEPISYDHARASFAALTDAMQIFLPENCRNSYDEEDHFKCYYAHNVYKTLSVPLFIVEDLFDYSKLSFLNLSLNGFPSSDQSEYLAGYQDAVRQSTEWQLHEGDGVFLPSCYGHGTPNAQLLSSNHFSSSYVTRDQATAHWYYMTGHDLDNILIDDCESTTSGVPCNTGCD